LESLRGILLGRRVGGVPIIDKELDDVVVEERS
jgi:hypothetical protein